MPNQRAIYLLVGLQPNYHSQQFRTIVYTLVWLIITIIIIIIIIIIIVIIIIVVVVVISLYKNSLYAYMYSTAQK